ncbi:hypothetical protein N566_01250, partial [Streptomycetaceae bacterium MP113-05]
GHRVKEFALEVRAGMAQREDELGDALGLQASPDGDHPELTARTVRRPQPGITPHTYDRNEDH